MRERDFKLLDAGTIVWFNFSHLRWRREVVEHLDISQLWQFYLYLCRDADFNTNKNFLHWLLLWYALAIVNWASLAIVTNWFKRGAFQQRINLFAIVIWMIDRVKIFVCHHLGALAWDCEFFELFYLSYKLVLAGSTISLWMWKKITLFPSWCLCRLFGHGHSQQQNFPSTFGDSSPFPSFLTNCCYFVLKYTLEKEEWRKWQTFQFSDRNLLRNCRGLIFTFHFSFLAYLTLMLTQSHTLTMCRKYDCFLLLAAGVLVFFFSRSPSNFSPTLVHLHVHVELMRKKSRR